MEVIRRFVTLCSCALIAIACLGAGVVLVFQPAKAREMVSRMQHSRMFFKAYQRNPFRRYAEPDSATMKAVYFWTGVMVSAWGLLFLAVLVEQLWIVLQ